MAVCALSWHEGRKEVYRTRMFFRGGKTIEGCWQCTDGLLTHLYPTEKRLRTSEGTGKQFWISPAHIRDIRRRRVAPDLSHTWIDKKGIGSNMRYR